jgi:endosialidase-like protein
MARAVLPAPSGGYPGQNTAEGDNALFSLTTGVSNTAIGFEALFSNTYGLGNTAVGDSALANNTSGTDNTALGEEALDSNTNGFGNVAIGSFALLLSTANQNTAIGFGALQSNTIGSNNTANGETALHNNTTGDANIALGYQAGYNLTTGSNNIDIGNTGLASDSKKIRIGKTGMQTATFIAGISGAPVPTGVPVIVDTNGHLGTIISSARYKEAIQPMDEASEGILALKPVTFRYKQELDPEGIPQFGLVAEEVEKVNPALVAHDDKGKPYTVRYEAVNAMLLNEFLKARRQIDMQQKQIEALTAGLQEVNTQLEASKSAPQTVFNGQ